MKAARSAKGTDILQMKIEESVSEEAIGLVGGMGGFLPGVALGKLTYLRELTKGPRGRSFQGCLCHLSELPAASVAHPMAASTDEGGPIDPWKRQLISSATTAPADKFEAR